MNEDGKCYVRVWAIICFTLIALVSVVEISCTARTALELEYARHGVVLEQPVVEEDTNE